MKSIQQHAKKFVDVHLMIVEPEKYVEEFINHGADLVSVHYEACTHLHRTINSVSYTHLDVYKRQTQYRELEIEYETT